MPMDERTKATVRALLDRYPRGYVEEATGFTVTNTAAGLFRLLCLSVLADDGAPSATAVEATKAVLARRWDSAPEMAKVDDRELARVLAEAGYDNAEEAGRWLADATRLVMGHYAGDLRQLRKAASGTPSGCRLLREIPGVQLGGGGLDLAGHGVGDGCADPDAHGLTWPLGEGELTVLSRSVEKPRSIRSAMCLASSRV